MVALNVEDLESCDEGVRITIRRLKTDQEGKGQTIAVLRGASAFCPVKLLREWLDGAGITEGALFRQVPKGGKRVGARLSGRAYYDVIKQGIAGLGLDATKYGSHSMRSTVSFSGHERLCRSHQRHVRSTPASRPTLCNAQVGSSGPPD